jgi:lysophospholipase L1-like esterase
MWPLPLIWLTLPVSAVQGLRLKRSAARLPGAAGDRRGSTGSGKPLQFLALGDSIIDGVGIERIEDTLAVQFAKMLAQSTGRAVNWRVEGQSGLDCEAVRARLDALEPSYVPELVLISVGVNDVTGLTSRQRWRERLTSLLGCLEQRWPESHALFTGLPPMEQFPLPPEPLSSTLGWRAAAFDRTAQQIIERLPRVRHVPSRIDRMKHGFCPDGFHPSADSCTLWARELAIIESRRESV